MIILIDVSFVSIIFVNLMSLISFFISKKIYDDVKLCQIYFYKFKISLLFDQK